MSRGAHLLQAIFGTYWAIRQDKLEAMLAFLDERVDGTRFSAEEIAARIGDARAARKETPPGTGVAVLPLFGIVSHRAHMVQDISGPGGTSTELFGRDFDQALADPKVGAIVLDVDSPGGSVSGVPELAQKIYDARGQKRIIAVANSLAASAAYWIASSADEVVVTPSGEVGSIGVYAIHTDTSRRDANLGVQRTVLKAGRHKAEGVPFQPLDGDARAYAQQQIDEFYGLFIDAVARQRGVSTEVARGERFGEGRTVTAKQAMANRMVDRVATLEQVLAELGVSAGNGKPLRASRAEASTGDVPVAALTGITASGGTTTVHATASAVTMVLSPPMTAGPTLLLPEAREGAAAEPTSSLAPTAPQAKEQPVSTQITPAPGSPGAPEPNAAQAELDRQTRIRELCELAKADFKTMNDFITQGTSVEDARKALIAARPKAQPLFGVHVGADREAQRPFTSLGEQLGEVRKAALNPHSVNPRLLEVNAAALGAGETIGADGGFLIQSDLLSLSIEKMFEGNAILSRVRRVPISVGRNGVKFWVVDEDSRINGSRFGGLQMRWVGEGDTVTPTKPKMRRMELELKKLMGFAYVSEEEMEDAPAYGSMLEQAFADEAEYMLEDAVIAGTGSAMPLGILSSKALVSVAIEAGQTIANTNTHVVKNAANMKAAIPPKIYQRGVWLANSEFEPALITATLGGTSVPVFLPQGSAANSPYAQLLGRPLVFIEQAPAVGTPGDFMFAGLSEYVVADKAGVRKAWSAHVQFLTDQQCFRITLRADGQPLWKDSVTPAKGSVKRSPFVALAARS